MDDSSSNREMSISGGIAMATFIFGSGLRPVERDITDQVVDEESPADEGIADQVVDRKPTARKARPPLPSYARELENHGLTMTRETWIRLHLHTTAIRQKRVNLVAEEILLRWLRRYGEMRELIDSPDFWDWLEEERDNPLFPLPDESAESAGDEASDTAAA
jgi:hypothetical protein